METADHGRTSLARGPMRPDERCRFDLKFIFQITGNIVYLLGVIDPVWLAEEKSAHLSAGHRVGPRDQPRMQFAGQADRHPGKASP